ncbi:C40 family peptidase [Bradyrhizobium sp. 5.13L]
MIVVWRHHVGVITGRAANGEWIVKSGNDGNRVRERPRSLARVIALRVP